MWRFDHFGLPFILLRCWFFAIIEVFRVFLHLWFRCLLLCVLNGVNRGATGCVCSRSKCKHCCCAFLERWYIVKWAAAATVKPKKNDFHSSRFYPMRFGSPVHACYGLNEAIYRNIQDEAAPSSIYACVYWVHEFWAFLSIELHVQCQITVHPIYFVYPCTHTHEAPFKQQSAIIFHSFE